MSSEVASLTSFLKESHTEKDKNKRNYVMKNRSLIENNIEYLAFLYL